MRSPIADLALIIIDQRLNTEQGVQIGLCVFRVDHIHVTRYRWNCRFPRRLRVCRKFRKVSDSHLTPHHLAKVDDATAIIGDHCDTKVVRQGSAIAKLSS